MKKFNPNNKPHHPVKPLKTQIVTKTVYDCTVYEYCDEKIPFDDIKGATHINIKGNIDYGYGCCGSASIDSVTLNFIKKEEVENPKYELQLKEYNEKLQQYESDLKEWTTKKKEYDKGRKDEELEAKRRQLKKLKKELGEI